MSRRLAALGCAVILVAAGCSSDDSADSTPATDAAPPTDAGSDTTVADTTADTATTDTVPSDSAAPDSAPPGTEASTEDGTGDLESLGLWDDGPCDDSLAPLTVGLIATFESGVLTAKDQAIALEASADAFNARGGANGHCIVPITCDEKADPNAALACVGTFDDAGVSVTINDSSTVQGPEVPEALAAAGIPRFAISSSQTSDLSDLNSYPIDAGGLGTTLMMPSSLLDEGITNTAIIRVDVPGTSAVLDIYDSMYTDDGLEILADIPVPAGTTDYTQFVIAAEDSGAEGVILPLGGQEAIQVLRAAQSLDSDLVFSTSLGTFNRSDMASLGDFADHIRLNGALAPATADVPILDVLTADLAASGEDLLQRDDLKISPMRGWLGIYALLTILRADGTDDFSRENITSLIGASGEIDMLGMTANWTPLTDNPGIFPRSGNGYYGLWKWDPTAEFDGEAGNFVQTGEANFLELSCGTVIGADASTC